MAVKKREQTFVSVSFFWSPERAAPGNKREYRHPWGVLRHPPGGHWSLVREAFLLGVAWKKWHFFNCKYLMNNRNTLLRCASFWNNIQNAIPVHSRFTWNKRELPRTIQNWHFVRRMARRKSGVIPRIRAAQGASERTAPSAAARERLSRSGGIIQNANFV